jgi:hypothetical protein
MGQGGKHDFDPSQMLDWIPKRTAVNLQSSTSGDP